MSLKKNQAIAGEGNILVMLTFQICLWVPR